MANESLVFSRWSGRIALLAVSVLLGTGLASAQAVAEYGGIKSGVAGGAAAKPLSVPTPKQEQGPSAHLPPRSGPAPAEVNRKALEERAGKDAGQLLLRSVPGGARVWIDGKFVGNTPMTLPLAPGKYTVEMRGKREESARGQIEIPSREKREITLSLLARYPSSIRVR